MTPSDYLIESARTASTQFHGDKVSQIAFEVTIHDLLVEHRQLDDLKRALFYGQDKNLLWDQTETVERPENPDLVHGIIGAATEGGELLEALLQPKIDTINLVEEVGDQLWYLAMILRAIGSTFEEAMDKNIAKLRARYPEKFNSDQAVNRDLATERHVLAAE